MLSGVETTYKMPTKIFVGNLDVESSPELEAELKSLFAQFGTVTECAILTGKNFGFVVSIANHIL